MTHPIEARRALRLWAIDKPQHVKDQVWTICAQMYAHQRIENPVARRIAAKAIEANVRRLTSHPTGEPRDERHRSHQEHRG